MTWIIWESKNPFDTKKTIFFMEVDLNWVNRSGITMFESKMIYVEFGMILLDIWVLKRLLER